MGEEVGESMNSRLQAFALRAVAPFSCRRAHGNDGRRISYIQGISPI